MKKVFLTILGLYFTQSIAFACTVCFYGSPEEAMNKGLNAAVILLLAVLAVIMAVFIQFFINFRKRSRSLNQ